MDDAWDEMDVLNLLGLGLHRWRNRSAYDDAAGMVFSNGTEHEIAQATALEVLACSPFLRLVLFEGVRQLRGLDPFEAFVMAAAAGDRTTMLRLEREARAADR